MKQKSQKPKILLLEKIVINWAIPFEIIYTSHPYLLDKLDLLSIKPKLKKYLDEYGLVKGLWMSKIKEYERLVDHPQNTKKKVLDLYENTPCGTIMKLTYKFLEKTKIKKYFISAGFK